LFVFDYNKICFSDESGGKPNLDEAFIILLKDNIPRI